MCGTFKTITSSTAFHGRLLKTATPTVLHGRSVTFAPWSQYKTIIIFYNAPHVEHFGVIVYHIYIYIYIYIYISLRILSRYCFCQVSKSPSSTLLSTLSFYVVNNLSICKLYQSCHTMLKSARLMYIT